MALDHAGLELAKVLYKIPKGDFDALMNVMREATEQMKIVLDSADYKAMLIAPEIVQIQCDTKRQQFFRELFLLSVENGGDCR